MAAVARSAVGREPATRHDEGAIILLRLEVPHDFMRRDMTASVRYSTDASEVGDQALAALYESVGFGTAEAYLAKSDFAARVFAPGVYGVFAFDDGGQLVGMARVLSDDFLCSWIAEVCVAPAWQRQSIGSSLIARVVERFGHTAIYTEAFAEKVGLFSTAGIRAKSKLVACSRAALDDPTRMPESFMH